jgi:hypothetical protein
MLLQVNALGKVWDLFLVSGRQLHVSTRHLAAVRFQSLDDGFYVHSSSSIAMQAAQCAFDPNACMLAAILTFVKPMVGRSDKL